MNNKYSRRTRKMNKISFLGNKNTNLKNINRKAFSKDIIEVKIFQNKNNKQFNLPVMKQHTSPKIIKDVLSNKDIIGLKFKITDLVFKKKTSQPLRMVPSLKVSKELYNTNQKPHINLERNKIFNPAYNVSKTREMNWKQLKQKFPMMNPTADSDFDGLINSRDCKPLDPSKDGMFSRFIGKVTGDKYGQTAEEYKEERELKKEQKVQKKEAIAERKESKKEAKIRKKEMEVAEQVTEKGYAPTEREIKGEMRTEKLKGLRAKFKAKAKAMEEKFKPEKTLMGRLVKKALPKTTYKTVMVKGKPVRVATTTGGILPVTKKQHGAITKTVERFAGVRGPVTKVGKTAKGVKRDGAGRPKGSYKYKDPRTGEPITAIQYHKLRKQLKSQAKIVETRAEIQQRIALAKRGLSPEEVAIAQEEMNAKMARLRALKEAKQSQEIVQPEVITQPEEIIEEVPEEIIEEVPEGTIAEVQYQKSQIKSGDIPPGYRLQDDIMTGKKRLVKLPQQEAWTR